MQHLGFLGFTLVLKLTWKSNENLVYFGIALMMMITFASKNGKIQRSCGDCVELTTHILSRQSISRSEKCVCVLWRLEIRRKCNQSLRLNPISLLYIFLLDRRIDLFATENDIRIKLNMKTYRKLALFYFVSCSHLSLTHFQPLFASTDYTPNP